MMKIFFNNKTVLCTLIACMAILVLTVPVMAATTQLHIVKYANDGITVLNETTKTYQWLEANLPVMGDGTTHYYHQGPVFVDDPDEATEQQLRWNPDEDTNVLEKDMGAVKGTNLKNICNLVGGMNDGETVRIKASDGLYKTFAYQNVYGFSSREGPMVITWYCAGLASYPGPYPDTGYTDGMRLVWFADTSVNPWGEHVFGNFDWYEAAAPEYWYYYISGSEQYPTTTGLSVKYISDVLIYSDDPPPLPPVAAFSATPRSGTAPLTVSFTDSSTGTGPLSYAWDFKNDGSVDSTLQNPSFQYTAAGTYTVKLTVTNAAGSDSETKAGYITVSGAPPAAPVAAFTGTPLSGTAPLGVTFTDSSTGTSITNRRWDFGDGNTSNYAVSTNPFHSYSSAGTYSVNLTVTNAGGSNSLLRSGYVTVTPIVLTDTMTEIGVVRNGNTWLLDASGDGRYGAGDVAYVFGKAGDVYVTGDWNNDGKSEIGVVRNGNTWYLDASGNGAYGVGDLAYSFGKAGDVYVTGDWNKDGKSHIGVVRNGNTWLLDASGDGRYGAGDVAYVFGKAGDVYVTGDWNNDGKSEIGVVRNGNTWYLDASGNGAYGVGDLAYSFGKAGDVYVSGDWNKDGKSEIGIVRNGNTWYLDASGNGAYGAGDLAYGFGKTGDTPVTGRWD